MNIIERFKPDKSGMYVCVCGGGGGIWLTSKGGSALGCKKNPAVRPPNRKGKAGESEG